MRSVFFIVVVLAGCAAPEPRSSTCDRVREHAIDLRLAAIGGDAAELAKHRIALAGARSADEDCHAGLTDEQIKCQLAAADLDAFRACTHSEETP